MIPLLMIDAIHFKPFNHIIKFEQFNKMTKIKKKNSILLPVYTEPGSYKKVA